MGELNVVPRDQAPEAPEAPEHSPRAELQERLDAARAARYMERSIPGLGDDLDLVARFRALSPDEADAVNTITEKARSRSTDVGEVAASMFEGCQIIVKTCIGIYERVNGELRTRGKVLKAEGDRVLTFKAPELAALLGTDPDKPQEAVRRLYGDQDLTIPALARRIFAYSQSDSDEERERLAGN